MYQLIKSFCCLKKKRKKKAFTHTVTCAGWIQGVWIGSIIIHLSVRINQSYILSLTHYLVYFKHNRSIYAYFSSTWCWKMWKKWFWILILIINIENEVLIENKGKTGGAQNVRPFLSNNLSSMYPDIAIAWGRTSRGDNLGLWMKMMVQLSDTSSNYFIEPDFSGKNWYVQLYILSYRLILTHIVLLKLVLCFLNSLAQSMAFDMMAFWDKKKGMIT